MTPQPYPDEPGWWTDTLDEIGELYKSVGQTFNLGMFKWGTRISYDIADGLTKEASKAKHLRVLKRELGITTPLPPPGEKRTDVRLVGKTWQDSNGPFRPLGTTFMWALGGMLRREKDRVGENFAWMQRHRIDYARMLCQVSWTGEEIDPFHPEYPQKLGELIDYGYDDFGIMSMLTIIAGREHGDVERIASIVRDVVVSRKHKVIMQESVNEGNASEEEAIKVAKALAPLGIPFGVGLGNQGLATIKSAGDQANATIDYYHTERTEGDNGARQVRQCWNFREFKRACAEGEPPGIGSSVAQFTDPFKMAAKRAANTICGSSIFCLHTGAGVFGRRMITTTGILREANLFEVQGLDEMVDAVRMATVHIPNGVENWATFNTNQPVKGVTGRMNKLYGARSGKQFVEIAFGCEDSTNVFVAQEGACDVTVANPATGETQEFSLKKGDTFQVSGLWAYLIVGTLK